MKIKYFFLIALGFYCQILTAQSSPGISPEFKLEIDRYLSFSVPTISVAQLEATKENFIILDAREKEEYEVSHIPGARYTGYDHFKIKNLNILDRNMPVVVYCSIGYRSEKIGEKLKKVGFKKVYNLYGSLFAWANAGYRMQDISGKTTNRIHGYNKSWSKWVTNKQLDVSH